MDEFDAAERAGLADILKRVTTRYDNVFEAPFPYTMGFHQRPSDGESHPEMHFHAHYYPPLRCAQQPSVNSWSALRCWACRSGISRPKAPRPGCALCRRPTIWIADYCSLKI